MSKIAELEADLMESRFDIVGPQDTRLGARDIAVKGCRVFQPDVEFCGTSKQGGGVLFLVSEALTPAVSKEPCRTKDQVWVRVSSSGPRSDLVCCAYMPQEKERKEVRGGGVRGPQRYGCVLQVGHD